MHICVYVSLHIHINGYGKIPKKEQRKMKIDMSNKIREISTVKERSVLGIRESGKTRPFHAKKLESHSTRADVGFK